MSDRRHRLKSIAPWVIDGLTAIVALAIALTHTASPMEIERVTTWLLVVLSLLAVSGVVSRLGFTDEIRTSVISILDLSRNLANSLKDLAEPLLVNYKNLDSFPVRIRNAKEVWISGRTLSSLVGQFGDELRNKVSEDEGSVRILVVDPDGDIAKAQSANPFADQRTRDVPARAASTIEGLQAIRMELGQHADAFQVRKLDYSPRFSLLITDPESIDGVVQVQVLSHLRSSGSRPILRLKRVGQAHWYMDFIDQFQQLWEAGEEPTGMLAEEARAA